MSRVGVALGGLLLVVGVVVAGTAAGGVAAAQAGHVGEVVTVAGDGERRDREGHGTQASLDTPSAVAEAAGSVYVATLAAVMRYNLGSGEVTRLAGGPSVGCQDTAPGVDARLMSTDDMAVRGLDLVLASRSCNAVRAVSLLAGDVTTLAQVSNPRGVAVGPDGKIYVAHGDRVSTLVPDPDPGPADPPYVVATFVTLEHGGAFSYPRPTALSAAGDALWMAVGSASSSTAVRLARVDWETREVSVLTTDAALRSDVVLATQEAVHAATGTAVRRYDKADGSWSVIAGTSAAGFADGVGADAWFGAVSSLDGAGGTLWVADRGNHRLRRITPADPPPVEHGPQGPPIEWGEAVTVAGGDGSLSQPTAVAVAGDRAYVAGRGVIRAVEPDGSVVTLAGRPDTYGSVDSTDPDAVRFSGDLRQLTTDGRFLYVADHGGGRIRRVSLSTGATSTVVALSAPAGLWFHDGTLYVSRSSWLFAVDPASGQHEILATFSGISYAVGGAVAADDEAVWVALGRGGSYHTRLMRVDRATGAVTTVAEDGALQRFAIASAGEHVFVATTAAVRRYDKADGSWVPAAGTSAAGFADGVGFDAWFSSIRSIAASTEALYVADHGNDRLRRVDAATPVPATEPPQGPPVTLGAVGTVARGEGDGPTDDLYRPGAVAAVGGTAYVVVAGAVQAVRPDGGVTTLAGQPGATGTVDSADPASARFSGSVPQMATDGVYLYLAERSSNRIRRVSLRTGATSTVGPLSSPRGIAYRDGFLYVSSGAAVRRMHPHTGAVDTLVALTHGGEFSWPQAAALSVDDDALWVAVGSQSSLVVPRIARVDWDSTEATVLAQDTGLGINALASAEEYVFAATRTGLRRYAKSDGASTMPAGTPATAGDADGTGGSARFGWIEGLATDGDALYVTDLANDAVRLVYDYEFVRDPADLKGNAWYSAFVSDPVNAATGNFLQEETDLAFPPAAAALAVTRTYNSAYLGTTGGVLGPGWTWSHGERLEAAAGGAVRWHRGDGRVATFAPDAEAYVRPLELRGDLVAAGVGWELRFDDGAVARFAADGRLLARVQPDGVTVDYAYADGRVVSASASSGHTLAFAYDAGDRLVSVTSGDGRAVSYAYTAAGALASVTAADGAVRGFVTDARGRVTRVADGEGRLVVANTYDAFGRVAAQQTPTGNTITFDYDTAGRVTRVTDAAAGTTTEFVHDEAARLVGITDAGGASVSRGYSLDGHPVTATDRAGATATQAVDARGNVLSRTHADGTVESWSYDALDRVTSQTDEAGGTTTLAYDGEARQPVTITRPGGGVTTQTIAGGLVTARTDPDGVSEAYGYDGARNLVSVTDGAGATTTLEHDAAGRLVGSTSPLGHATAFVYDAAGRLTSGTDATGATTSYAYDAAGNLLSETDPAGAVTTYAYDAAGLLASVTDPLGQVTHYAHDPMEQLVAVTRPGGATTSYGWGPLGRLAVETDAAGSTTSYGYDVDGNVVSAVDALGGESVTAYDARGRVVATTDPLGRTTVYAYGPAGRLVSETAPDGAVTTHAYDADGRLVETTDARGHTVTRTWTPGGRLAAVTDRGGQETTFGYDAAGRLATDTTPLGQTTTHTYDLDGRLAWRSSPEGLVTGYAYDAAGRVVGVTAPDGGTTATTYTSRGQVATVTDPAGGMQAFVYDAAGRLVEVTDAAGGTTTYGYDGRGNPVTRTDAAGHVETYGYDLADRPVEVTDPLGRATATGYDALGRVAGVADASGRSREHAYDAAGQLRALTYGDGSVVAYAYDLAGRLVGAAEGSGVLAYAYDPVGNLTGFTDAAGAQWQFGYDPSGRRTTLAYPDGPLVGYGYDPDGRMTTVTVDGAVAVAYGYDGDGRLVAEDLPGAGSRAWTHAGGRVVAYSQTLDGQAWSTTLERDLAGRVTAEVTGGVRTDYGYDAAGQLVSAVTAGGPEVGFVYDLLGQRSAHNSDGQVTGYTHDAAGQLVALHGPAGSTTITYDPAGRRTAEFGPDSLTGYSYDAAGRLAAVIVDDGAGVTAVERGWDAAGRLATLTATDNGGGGGSVATTVLAWDPVEVVGQVLRLDRDGDAVDLVYGHRRVLARDAAGGLAAFASDHLGSTLATPATAGLAAAGGYGLFGDPAGGLDAAAVVFGYRGELHTGALLHLRQRDYQPATGAFLVRDPLDGVPGRATLANPYHYAHNDPLGHTDPLGLRPWNDTDTRCWLLHGACRELGGDLAWGFVGVAHAALDMGVDSVRTWHDPLSVSRGLVGAYYDAGGGAWGVYEAANLANPLYHVLAAGDACVQANRGTIDVHAASRACTHAAVTTASTLAGATAATRPSLTRLSSRAPQAVSQSTELAVRNPITRHAAEQMAERGITRPMVDTAIQRGTPYFDARNGTISYVLEGGFASGRTLQVAVDPFTGNVVTAIRRSGFNPLTLLESGAPRYTPIP